MTHGPAGRTRTRSSKFTIVISELDQAQLHDLLPSGINFGRLRALIDFLLRDGLAYLSQQVRDETHRTLAVIAEQKRQQIEDSLAERRLDA